MWHPGPVRDTPGLNLELEERIRPLGRAEGSVKTDQGDGFEVGSVG